MRAQARRPPASRGSSPTRRGGCAADPFPRSSAREHQVQILARSSRDQLARGDERVCEQLDALLAHVIRPAVQDGDLRQSQRGLAHPPAGSKRSVSTPRPQRTTRAGLYAESLARRLVGGGAERERPGRRRRRSADERIAIADRRPAARPSAGRRRPGARCGSCQSSGGSSARPRTATRRRPPGRASRRGSQLEASLRLRASTSDRERLGMPIRQAGDRRAPRISATARTGGGRRSGSVPIDLDLEGWARREGVSPRSFASRRALSDPVGARIATRGRSPSSRSGLRSRGRPRTGSLRAWPAHSPGMLSPARRESPRCTPRRGPPRPPPRLSGRRPLRDHDADGCAAACARAHGGRDGRGSA